MRALRILPLWLVAALAAACASTTIVDSWSDPNYRGGPFKRIVVVGVSQNQVARRTFEDIFSGKLRAAGVEAIPSYQVVPDAPGGGAALDAAAQKAGADGLLMVHLVRVDRQTRVVPSYSPGFYPSYYGYYQAWVAYPEVQTYDIATVEANLFSVASKQLVWGGTTETFNPQGVSRESAGFADVVIKALAKQGLVPGTK
jgi:hypothetical protein